MGSGNLLKTIIKKVKDDSSKQVKGSSASKKSNGLKWKKHQRKASIKTSFTSGNSNTLGMPIEDLAATQIQTAFRAYRARKHLRRLKGMVRLQAQTQTHSIKKQATTTLNYLYSWSNIQAQIRARRLCMVTEGRLREKKIANQLKLEAKLHDIEYKLRACRNLSERRFDVLTSVGMVIWRVEWSGGPETLEEVLTKIQQREEAAVKRERTMAYAFSHQWRAPNSNNNGLGNYELAKANWGWSWVERWIAVRPWESRLPTQSITPKKAKNRQISKAGKNSNSPKPKASVSVKPPLSNGKGTMKPRRLSYPGAEKPAVRKESTKTEEVNIQKEEIAT
ncbi:protein IQ-DOMAIN 1-like isoform X1 [Durio zibethinus]|uniref:Protein IQ-DOMAIN 1-like isoform X1 n=1 Tax=Durio zibethinus TaxID=66656 RepID=A0A6P5WI39_DURZI|nr:protein IQ-DOMAIN 1-like isoform X1 [Durio zibethinus]XP_022715782.1 protein IQ-DOMAIN 1-like isoform X1 [Durio zibethinus]XP_022715783.1 protein IQ-DOMAIN 1-like isoform X1 [Durio zibethinus]XP_022715784.1 protein IQ-DOMAIN 1-like isoform X1 [Durio zibethinus]XP_022715785.1 protein IQ-DOMAIN 1-like isoform X1 [Durio zibethinus]XP_022715786.1 protein IQ-DOMAIN 1-like isoform X1 [Durio zibethinus]XP_022715787.1 protein IQ-DOMAIN 1-like isoform X1 [Durio zibethinus]